MKVLLIRPFERPCVVELDDSLESMYEVLDCTTITAVYPWDDPVALVTDDEGLFSGKNKTPSRYIDELQQPILGNFFICGLGNEDFTDLPDQFLKKYMEMFWKPEVILLTSSGAIIIEVDNGTKPKE